MDEFPRGLRPPEVPISKTEIKKPPETGRESVSNVAAQMENVVREYGLDTLQEILKKMQQAVFEGRAIKAAELEKVIETRPSRLEFQKTVLEILENIGFVETLPDGRLVVDSDKILHNFSIRDLQRLPGNSLQDFALYTNNRLQFLAEALADKKVLLRSDYADNPVEAIEKPFFYLPETLDDALDLNKIRQSDFHFGLWEVSKGTRGGGDNAMGLAQPASLTRQTFFETSLAAVIYHPKYGHARRDQQGRLVVRDGDREVPFSGSWLKKQGFTFSHESIRQYVSTRPKEAITQFAPHAVERGLIRPEDFARVRHNNRAQETLRIGNNGQISLEGVRHYLGRQYVGRSLRIDDIDHGLAAIVELDDQGLGQPIGLINTFKKGNPNLIERETRTGSFFEAGGKITHPREFSEQEFMQPKPDENPDEFFARKQKFDAFKAVLDFDNALKQEASLSIYDISPTLQKELREQGAKLLGQEDIALRFTQSFDKEGLEIVAAVLGNVALSEKVLKTVLELPDAEKNTLIPTLRDALVARHAALKELDQRRSLGQVTDLEYRKMQFEMNRRVTSLITAAEDSAAIHESLTSHTKQAALERLSEQGGELILFSSIFRDAFKNTNQMDFEQLRGLAVTTEHSGQIDEATRQSMLVIFEDNWRGQKPEALPSLRQGFVDKLEHSQGTQFQILKKDGRVVAFIRFDERPDLEPGALYGGSLNVDPSLRGSAIGEAMMKASVDTAAKDHTIYADVFPELIVGIKYVEDLGCVITGVEEIRLGDTSKTTKRLLLKRNDKENQMYNRDPKKSQTISIDTRLDASALVEAIDKYTRQGLVATRYYADPAQPHLRTLVFEPKAQLDTVSIETQTANAA